MFRATPRAFATDAKARDVAVGAIDRGFDKSFDKDGRAFSRLFFASADEVRLDAQGRVTIPQRLRDVVGIKKEVVVLGVRERMEIWDRGEFERYRDVHAAAYENGELEPRGPQPRGP